MRGMDSQASKPEAEEAIDEIVRRALHDQVGPAEPSDRVWQQISRQVTAGTARRCTLPQPRRLAGWLAPVAQGLAATALLLLMGMSLRPDLWQRAYLFGAGDRIQEIEVATDVPTPALPTRFEQVVVDTEPEDHDSLAARWRSSKQSKPKPAAADARWQEREADLAAAIPPERKTLAEAPEEIAPDHRSAEKPLPAVPPKQPPSRQPYSPPTRPF